MRRIPKLKWHMPPPMVHVLVWLFIYLIPVVLMYPYNENSWQIRHWTTAPFLATLVSFYANYSFLVPKFLYTKRVVVYVTANLVILLAIFYLIRFFGDYEFAKPPVEEPKRIIKGLIGLIFVSGVAISIRSTSMWFHSRDAMQKLELENVRTELSFLKMQLSPHFLFNTLNNILTLIDENKEMAKQSVQQLSNLLRSVLYEFKADTVTIKQEVEFLTNYSNLMKLRYGSELNFNLETDLDEPDAPIASLLLIPLLENIFKHGIGASVKDSFINIKISSKKGKIIFESANTYFPKTNQDKSGSGIGIANMKKRLDLLYENNFLYDCKVAGSDYIVKLEINVDSPN